MCFSLIHNERFLSIAVSQPFQIDLYLFERKFFIVVYKITTIWKDWARYIKVHGLGSLHSLPSIGTTYYKNIEISSLKSTCWKRRSSLQSAELCQSTKRLGSSISVSQVFILQKKLKEAALCMDTAAVSNQPSWSLLWVTRHNWDLLHQAGATSVPCR